MRPIRLLAFALAASTATGCGSSSRIDATDGGAQASYVPTSPFLGVAPGPASNRATTSPSTDINRPARQSPEPTRARGNPPAPVTSTTSPPFPVVTGPLRVTDPTRIPGNGVPLDLLPPSLRLPVSTSSRSGYVAPTQKQGIFYLAVNASPRATLDFFRQAYRSGGPWTQDTTDPTKPFLFRAWNPHDKHGFLGAAFTIHPAAANQSTVQAQWLYVAYRP